MPVRMLMSMNKILLQRISFDPFSIPLKETIHNFIRKTVGPLLHRRKNLKHDKVGILYTPHIVGCHLRFSFDVLWI